MKNTLMGLLLFAAIGLFAQAPDFNLELIAEVNPQNTFNDIWGYVDTDGTEYALLGSRNAVHIYRLSDPTNPVLAATVSGHGTIWRDIKSFDSYIYVTADGTSDPNPDGLTIVDMSSIGSDEVTVQKINDFVGEDGLMASFGTCHNLNIDVPNGILSLSGCNDNSGGNLYFDLNEDAFNPKLIRRGPAIYSHDNVTQGGFTYSSDLGAGLNIINSATGEIVGNQMTGTDFTHNAWPSDDGNFIFTTDERANAYVESYDIKDKENIQFLDRYRPSATDGTGVIPHNTHYADGYLVTSYYTDGLKILDANEPDILVEVASFDTWFNPGQGFNGLWGAYPYLPSGLILGADIQRGLLVWRPTYQRARYLVGDVKDGGTGNPIFDALIVVEDATFSSSKSSDAQGLFKTGLGQESTATSNMVTVTVTKLGYNTYQEMMELTPGERTEIHVELNAGASVTGQVTDIADMTVLPNSSIYLIRGLDAFEYKTDAAGNFVGPIFPGVYTGFVGKWGYDMQVISNLDISAGEALSFELTAGDYFDEFALDLGWQVDNQGTTGFWERVEPVGTSDDGAQSNPEMDSDQDISDQCYITGNGGGIAANDDIDGGTNRLISPMTDVSAYVSPSLEFDYWFYVGGGNTAFNDSLEILVTDGVTTASVFLTGDISGDWVSSSVFDLTQYGLDLNNPIQIIAEASDNSPGHLVEAGIDRVRVYDANIVATQNILDRDLVLVKNNPTIDYFEVVLDEKLIGGQAKIFSTEGRLMETINDLSSSFNVGGEYIPGFYFIEFSNDQGTLVKKLIKN